MLEIIDHYWWVWLLGVIGGFGFFYHAALSFDSSSRLFKYAPAGAAFAYLSLMLLLVSTIINVAQYIIANP